MTLPADIDDRSFRGRDEARPMSRMLYIERGDCCRWAPLGGTTRPESRRSDDVNAFSWPAVRPATRRVQRSRFSRCTWYPALAGLTRSAWRRTPRIVTALSA